MAGEELLKRLPPYSSEAEKALLGVLLKTPRVLSEIGDVQEDDFFDERHRLIFRAIVDMADHGQGVDPVTVSEWLEKKKLLERAGGISYLAQIQDAPVIVSHFTAYKNILLEKSLLRALIRASEGIIQTCYESQRAIEEICNEAEKSIFDVTNRRLRTDFVHIKDVLMRGVSTVELHKRGEVVFSGYSSGYHDLDEKILGLQKQDMIVLAARPSMGKTAFALNIALRLTEVHPDVAVMIFSLEMSNLELAFRAISCASRIPLHKIRSAKISKEEMDQLVDTAGSLSRKNILLDDTPAISLNELRSKARRAKSRYPNLGLIIIDHIQLIRTSDSIVSNRVQELSYISRNLKALAKELDIPVMVLSQLSRAVDQREDHRPILSDLRDSGAIEQDADLVMFLYREEYYKPNTEKKNIVEVIIAKQRNGAVGSVELAFFGETTRFEELEKGFVSSPERHGGGDREF
ncbi:MAG: replicative DNA helicase [Brevinematales bacterium]|nr:replicative DNA helicase [Brevinematales bacterium]